MHCTFLHNFSAIRMTWCIKKSLAALRPAFLSCRMKRGWDGKSRRLDEAQITVCNITCSCRGASNPRGKWCGEVAGKMQEAFTHVFSITSKKGRNQNASSSHLADGLQQQTSLDLREDMKIFLTHRVPEEGLQEGSRAAFTEAQEDT